jgi:hypothetical protein
MAVAASLETGGFACGGTIASAAERFQKPVANAYLID